MEYDQEIRKYMQMYEATPIGKWLSRQLIAKKIDTLMIERSKSRKDQTIERFIPDFSYAVHIHKPKFEPRAEPPSFIKNG